ncbi:MAG: hypothetical protein K0Q79_3768 [Flavipsychrobacter sp.]|jgi:hypothetical protein|nr:hypothetical protein [Flavipsychrobacter sp.]
MYNEYACAIHECQRHISEIYSATELAVYPFLFKYKVTIKVVIIIKKIRGTIAADFSNSYVVYTPTIGISCG